MKHSKLLEQWRERIVDYRASGLSGARWCERTGQSIWQLRYWINRINKIDSLSAGPDRTTASDGWARVELAAPKASATSTGIRICMGSARIEVDAGFDKSALSEVLAVVASLC
jgi:hypothetical protein